MAWLRPPGPVADGLSIGLFGGSFNPAHAGHLYVAETAIKQLGLDYVWFLVAPQNPLKPTNGMRPLCHRLATARHLTRHNRRLIVSDLEQNLTSRYTIDTVKTLQARFSGVRFVWLMGSDNLEQFHRWRHWEEIAARLPLAVVLRPGWTLAPLKAKAAKRLWRHIAIIDGRRNEMSATAIRARGGERKRTVIQAQGAEEIRASANGERS